MLGHKKIGWVWRIWPAIGRLLSGKGIGPPTEVRFRDLWGRSQTYRGRHVIVNGRVQRVFRQEPVGDFPALAEVWISSPAGDPYCLVFPLPGLVPDRGRAVRFTGTFLKMVRYAAQDGDRLAPLVVGSGPATLQPTGVVHPAIGMHESSARLDQWTWSPVTWLLGLTMAALAAGLLAWRHLHSPSRRPVAKSQTAPHALDPPLEFIDTRDHLEA